ncbi:CoA ester lyase [Aureimonas sp. OT7]|uniref:HpcH/HpaI aldolase/citrate lyase family protein n=1 Tax=Aureimonas TaxID=414371 RepID=UPI00177B61EC|nr:MULTISPECIES: CoA ester lyase [Aureimonas]QOG08819.1 CoA ester lyase [Aureimonas sp. OT7]
MMTRLQLAAPLFVPGNRPERFEKAAASGADAIIIDLEDAVAADDKEAARAALRAGFGSVPIIVRVNAPGTQWHAADMAAVAGLDIAAVMVPKAEMGRGFAAALGDKPVIALVETARGLADARALAALDSVVLLAFGSIDFCADLGCAHTREALSAARCEIVLASRLAGIAAPLDGVTTAIDDASAIESDARHARELGFGGKLLIHPRQVAPALAGLMPDAAEIAWARRVVAAADGASKVDGAMVDAPVRLRAEALLSRARRSV